MTARRATSRRLVRSVWSSRAHSLSPRLVSLALLALFGPALAAPPETFPLAESAQRAIDAALPERARVPPRRPRRLLIFDRNVGYPGHPSIAWANYAFAALGRKTGAWESELSRDENVFSAAELRRFDAVFLDNTVGNLFTSPELRRSLVEFVTSGGGLLGVHGTSVAFTRWPGAREDWPEFGRMIGARGASHRDSDEHVFVKLDSPDHPLNAPFGGLPFEYRDEFFRFHEPYSRRRVRVLFSIDTARTDREQGRARGRVERSDGDYALAWVRGYGRGRVFYTTIGHQARTFADARMLQFFLGAVQFALGDLPAPTTPSARLTPAARALERLGWRLGLAADAFAGLGLLEAARRAGERGIGALEAAGGQPLGGGIEGSFGPGMSAEDRRRLRLALDDAGVRLLLLRLDASRIEEAAWRRWFGFARRLGIEAIVSAGSPSEAALDVIEPLCEELDLRFAIPDTAAPGSAPDALERCRARSARLGVAADERAWLRSGADPVEEVERLGRRLVTLRLADVDPERERGAASRRVRALEAMARRGLEPVMIALAEKGVSGTFFPSKLPVVKTPEEEEGP